MSRLTQDEPLSVLLQSRFLVLVDPLALDFLGEPLRAMAPLAEAARLEQLKRLETTLRVAVVEIPEFQPGVYSVGPGDIEPAADTETDVVDVDSGAIVVTDLATLPALAEALPWDEYDLLLSAFSEETSRRLVDALDGPRFAVLLGDADRPFAGDGVYRLRHGAPTRAVSPAEDRPGTAPAPSTPSGHSGSTS